MKILVLGAGLQGSACAYDLLENEAVERVVIADLSPDRLPAFLEERRGDARLEPVRLDAKQEDAALELMGDVDVCLNALPYYFNPAMTGLAVEAGVHYADLGGNTDIVFGQLELDERARERGISVIPDCGLAPGMVNILSADGLSEMDQAESVRIFVGGLPKEPEGPLKYQVVYSLEGVLDYYTSPSFVLRGGSLHEVEALSEVEGVDFPAPVGRLEAFHTAGGASTMPWRLEGTLDTFEYKTLRYPGHADLMRSIRELGLLGLDPVDVKGQPVVPRDAFIAAVEPQLHKPDAEDVVALRVEVSGSREGAPHRVVYELLDFADTTNRISAMERSTGFSLSIIGQMQAEGRVARAGAATPDEVVPAADYMAELRRRGVEIHKRGE